MTDTTTPAALLWYIPTALLKDAKKWRENIEAAASSYKKKFELDAKVILHNEPDLKPDGLGYEFRLVKGLSSGHYVVCHDPKGFLGI